MLPSILRRYFASLSWKDCLILLANYFIDGLHAAIKKRHKSSSLTWFGPSNKERRASRLPDTLVKTHVLHGGWFISCSRFIIKSSLPTVCQPPTTVGTFEGSSKSVRQNTLTLDSRVDETIDHPSTNLPSVSSRTDSDETQRERCGKGEDSGQREDNWLFTAHFCYSEPYEMHLRLCGYSWELPTANETYTYVEGKTLPVSHSTSDRDGLSVSLIR